VDLRLTPDLIEIRDRSRRFCDEWLIPFEHETEEAGSLSMESYGRIRQAVLDAVDLALHHGAQPDRYRLATEPAVVRAA